MTQTQMDGGQAPPRRPLGRATEGRMVAGVCAGLGRSLDVDPVIFRIGFVVATLAGGAGVIAYAAAWLLLPRDDGPAIITVPPSVPAWVPYAVAGVLVLAVVDGFDHHPFGLGSVMVLAGIVARVLWSANQSRAGATSPPSPPAPRQAPERGGAGGGIPPDEPVSAAAPDAPSAPPPPPAVLGRMTVSLLLFAAAGALLLDRAGAVEVDPTVFFGVALVAVGAGLAVSAWIGRARGLIVLGVALTFTAAAVTVVDTPVDGGVGERIWAPRSTVAREYRLAAGEARLDLTHTAVRRARTEASIGVGSLLVIVPAGAAVDVEARAGIGEVVVFGVRSGGFGAERSVAARGTEFGPVIELDLRVGIGEVRVVRGAAA